MTRVQTGIAVKHHLMIGLGLVIVSVSVLSCAAVAASGTISQTYQVATGNVSQGALLSLVAAGNGKVELANSNSTKNLVGVASDKSLLAITDGGGSTLPVAVSGSADALVSDINGVVKTGDKITASPISGIGMKATESTEIVGTAQADFSSIQTTQQSVTKLNGKKTTIEVGLIPIDVNVTYYTAQAGSSDGIISSLIPPALQNIADAITGKQVSPLKLVLGTLALLFGFVVTTIMLYSSIRANIASIGRNPLAEGALRKGFIDVTIAALGVLIVAIIATYTILVV